MPVIGTRRVITWRKSRDKKFNTSDQLLSKKSWLIGVDQVKQ